MKIETCGKCGCTFSWDNSALFGSNPGTEWFSYICPECSREKTAQERHDEHEREAERRHRESMKNDDERPRETRSSEQYVPGCSTEQSLGQFILNLVVGLFSLLVVYASGFNGFFGIVFGSFGLIMVSEVLHFRAARSKISGSFGI